MRKIGRQRIEDRDHLLAVLDADVHVEPEDHQPPGRPLAPINEPQIPLLGCHPLLGPAGERVCADTGQLVAEVVAHGQELVESRTELSTHVADVRADVGVELDRRLDQLGLDTGVAVRLLEDTRRTRDEVLRLRIQDLQLELDAQGGVW